MALIQQEREDEEEEPTYQSELYVYFFVSVACLGSLFTGYEMGVFNSSQEALRSLMKIEEDDSAAFDGLMTGIIPIGGLLGSLLSNPILRRFSRKQSLMIADIIGVLGCLLQSWTEDIIIFSAGRFICGLVCGLNSSLVSLYVMEVAPIQMRQKISTLPVFALNVGTFIAYCSGLSFTSLSYSSSAVSFIYLFPISFAITRCVLLKFCVNADSAYFYLERGEFMKAKSELEQVYKSEALEQVYHDYHQTFIEKQKNQETFMDVFNRNNRRRVIIAITQMYFFHFVGISAIIFYSTMLFQRVTNQNEKLSYILTAISGIFPLVSSFISGILSQKYGRKPLLQWGMKGQAVITLILSLLSFFDSHDSVDKTPKWLQFLLIVNVISARSYISATYGPISLAYNSDICCQKGVSIAYMFYWGFQGIIGFTFPIALEFCGTSLLFLFFFANSVAGSLFVEYFIKETKGLTRTEIQLLFDPVFEKEITQKLEQGDSLRDSLCKINDINPRESIHLQRRIDLEMVSVPPIN